MYNAATYHIGNIEARKAEEPNPVIQQDCGVCNVAQTPKRCTGGKQGQAQGCASATTADAFLKTRFFPLIVEPPKEVITGRKAQKTERDILLSLSKLSAHFGIEILPITDYPFPYNISLALWDAEKKLKKKVVCYESLTLVQEKKTTFIQCNQRYDMGANIYHIPVLPLYRMLNSKTDRKAALLLLSVCSYLYHSADVPYYSHPASYIYDQYEMTREWVENDFEDDDSRSNYLKDFEVVDFIGDCIGKKIGNLKTLHFLEQRLANFKPHNEFEKEVQKIAAESLALYQGYPDQGIFRNAEGSQLSSEDMYEYYEEYEHITMQKLISFVAETESYLYQTLFEGLNNEFQEYTATEEPIVKIQFKGKVPKNKDLNFECRLFDLIGDLSVLLSDYKKQKP